MEPSVQMGPKRYHEFDETHEAQQSNHLLNGQNPERTVLPISVCFRKNRQLCDSQIARIERVADSIHQRPEPHFEPERKQIGDRIDFFAPLTHRLFALVGHRLLQSFSNEFGELRVVRRSDEGRRSQRHRCLQVLSNVRVELLFRRAVQTLLIDEVRVIDRNRLEGSRRLNRQRGQDFLGENRPGVRFDRLQHLQLLVEAVRIHRERRVRLAGVAQKQLARRSQRRRQRNRRRIQREPVQHRHEGIAEVAEKLLVERARRRGKNHRGQRARADLAGGRGLDGGGEFVRGNVVVVVDESGRHRAGIVEFLDHPILHSVVFIIDDEGGGWEKADVTARHLHVERLSK